MSVQLCLLRDGETIIADLKEVLDPEKNTSVGYRVSNPFIIDFGFRNLTKVVDQSVEELKEDDNNICFRPWAPLAKRTEFDFPHNFIEVIYEPHDEVLTSYISVIEHFKKKFLHEVTVDTDQTVVTTPDLNLESLQEIVNEESDK